MIRLLFVLFFIFSLNAKGQWSDLAGGIQGFVYTMYYDSLTDELFVGGNFNLAGGQIANSIVTWNGFQWQVFGSNAIFSGSHSIYTISRYNGNIIVAGDFDSIGNVQVNNIAMWDGINWNPIGNGFNNAVYDVITYQGYLYAGGLFGLSGSDTISHIGRWDGAQWNSVTNLSGYILSFAISPFGKLIVAGAFHHQSIPGVNNIFQWDGNSIDTALNGFNNAVYKVKNINDTVIAVGKFSHSTAQSSQMISLYFNSSWHSIGYPSGGQNTVADVEEYMGKRYFCGYFSTPPDLCTYNNSTFDSVADVYGYIDVLNVYKNQLFVGGAFDSLQHAPMNSIASLNLNGSNIADNEQENYLIVTPNPVTGSLINFVIPSECAKGASVFEVSIFSSTGELLYEETKNTKIINIDIILQQGLYFIKYSIDNKNFIKKIISL